MRALLSAVGGLACASALLVGCSSGVTDEATSATASATASGQPARSAKPVPTDPAAAGDWIGDALARSAMPKKEDVTTVLGTSVTAGPDISTYSSKDLKLTAQIDPVSCTDVYALVWAITAPPDTTAMTTALYKAGNSDLVINIGDSKSSLAGLKSAVEACPQFRVVKTHGASTYAVGDSVSDFTISSVTMPTPDALDISVTSRAQILMSIEDTCMGTASPAPGCVENRTDVVNQSLRRSGSNLVSAWGVGTTEVDGKPSTDPQIPMAAVNQFADVVTAQVAALAKP